MARECINLWLAEHGELILAEMAAALSRSVIKSGETVTLTLAAPSESPPVRWEDLREVRRARANVLPFEIERGARTTATGRQPAGV
jgi:hypothetical protein